MHTQPILVLASLILFFNLFFFRVIGDFGIQLFFIGLFSYFLGTSNLQHTWKRHQAVLTIAGCLLALLTYFSLSVLNPTVQFLIHALSLFTVCATWYASISHRSIFLAAMEVFNIPVELLKSYFNSLDPLANSKKSVAWEQTGATISRFSHVSPYIRPVLVGLMVSLPVLGILVSLFSSADPVFAKFLKDLTSQKLPEKILWRVMLSVVLFFAWMPTVVMKIKDDFNNPIRQLRYLKFITEYTVVMLMVAIVTGLFLLVQWQYIFVPQVSGVDLSQYGIATYSEYVNKGFSELLTVSVFIFSLVWFGLILVRNESSQKALILKNVQFLVLAEFIVLLASVWRRIWLYQHFHGMTLVRYYGGYFLFFLLLLTISLAARHVVHKKFIRFEIIMGILSILGLAFFPAEKYIARYSPPTVNNRVDYVYLSRMSGDGYVGWEKSFVWSKTILDAQYPEGAVLSSNERREIAYAGMVVNQLMSKYHQLIVHHATYEEQKTYALAVIADSLTNIEQTRVRIEAKQAEALIHPNKNVLLNELGEHRNNLALAEKSLLEERERISKNEFNAQSFMIPVGQVPTTFNTTTCAFWGICSYKSSSLYNVPSSFYLKSLKNVNTKMDQPVLLDRIFSYSTVSEQLANDIQKDIPITELLRLQNQYFNLARRIGQQPETERGYESDISFDTPFLPARYER